MKKLQFCLPLMVLFLFQVSAIQSQQTGELSSTRQEHELRLNNGQKWKIDVDMMKHIREGEELLKKFISRSWTNYSRLAEDMGESNNNLIFSCSMTGEAHDLLHKWLHPHLRLVDNLKKAETAESALEIIEQLKYSYELFNSYFE